MSGPKPAAVSQHDRAVAESLLRSGRLDQTALANLVEESRRTGRASLVDLLIERGLIDPSEVGATVVGSASPPVQGATPRPMPPAPPSRAPSGRASVPGHGRAGGHDPGGTQQRIGRYEVLGELGRGGMGVVYRARDASLGRTVAIKMILAQLAQRSGPGAIERFAREARATARLRHPGIVAIHEVGSHEGNPFLVMDFVEGRDLDAVLHAERLAPRRVAELAREIALALAHAHDEGVIHRDVKPQNILIDAAGRCHLTDFGLAREIDSGSELTVSGQLLGTPSYMAPEQAGASRFEISPATDVYAVGGILYRALVGRVPFTGASQFELIKRVLLDEPERLRDQDPTIHPDLETITLKCLEKEPERRYPSATALADDLGRFLDGEAIAARPAGRRERLVRWARRNRALAATASAGLLAVTALLIAGVAGTVVAVRRIRAERDAAEAAKTTAEEESLRAQTAETDARAAAAREASERARAETARAEAEAARLESDAARERASTEGRRASQMSEARAELLARALADKGSVLASQGRDAMAAAFHAASLVLGENDAARSGILATLPRAARTLWVGPSITLRSIALHPSEPLAAVGDRDGAIRFFDLEKDREVAAWAHGPDPVRALAWSPDGRRVASGDEAGLVRVRTRVTAEEIAAFRTPDGVAVEAIAIESERDDAGDGHVVAALTDGTVLLWPVAFGGTARVVGAHAGGATAVAIARDGRILGAAGVDGRVALSTIPDGRPVASILIPSISPVRSIAFDDEGSRLVAAAADGTVVTLEIGARRAELVAFGRPTGGEVALSGDGRLIAAATTSGDVDVREVDAGPDSPARVMRAVGPGASNPMALDAAGRRLAIWNPIFGAAFCDVPARPGRRHYRSWLDAATERRSEWGGAAVEFRPDGLVLASCGDQRRALWHAESGRRLRKVTIGFGADRAIAWSPDGALLAQAKAETAGGPSGHRLTGATLIELFDPSTGDVVRTVAKAESTVLALAWSRDGRIAAALESGAVPIWDAASGEPVVSLAGHRGPVNDVAFSADGGHVATAGEDSLVRWFDAASGEQVRALRGHAGAVTSVAVTADRRLAVISGSRDGTVRIFRGAGGAGQILAQLTDEVEAVAAGPRGLVAAAAGGVVPVWDHRTGRRVVTLDGEPTRFVDVAISPDGQRVAAIDEAAVARVWSLETAGGLVNRRVAGPEAGSVRFGPRGKRLFIPAKDGAIRIHDPRSGRALGAITVTGSRAVTAADVLAPKRLIVGVAGSVEVVDDKGGVLGSRRLDERGGAVRVAPSPDGGLVAATSAGRDARLIVTDADLGADRISMEAPYASAPVWSPDGTRIAVGMLGAFLVIDVATGALERIPVPRDSGRAVAFTPDGTRIAAATTDRVSVLEADGLAEVATVPGVGTGVTLGWLRDGRHLLVGGDDGAVRIWSLVERRPRLVAVLRDHFAGIRAIDVSPDGRRIATLDDDGSVVIRDLSATGLQTPAVELADRVEATTAYRVDGFDALQAVHRLYVPRKQEPLPPVSPPPGEGD